MKLSCSHQISTIDDLVLLFGGLVCPECRKIIFSNHTEIFKAEYKKRLNNEKTKKALGSRHRRQFER